MELTDGREHTAHAYSTDIIFPQKIGGKLVYVKQVHVPETLKSGEYKVKICGLLKDGRKLCQKSDAFHIEGDQMECKHNNLHAANQSKCLDFRVSFSTCYREHCLIHLAHDSEEFGWSGLCGKSAAPIGHELAEFAQRSSACRFLR